MGHATLAAVALGGALGPVGERQGDELALPVDLSCHHALTLLEWRDEAADICRCIVRF